MRKITLFMHITLDGFTAGPNGEMDWIKVDNEIFDYAGHMTGNADAALYGRITYEMMEGYWPTAGDQPDASKHDIEHSRWYKSVEKVVISKTLKGKKIPNTRIIGDDLVTEIYELKQKAGKGIVIFGSPSASYPLTQHKLIDDYWLLVNPVLLGKGIPLFKDVNEKMNLKLVETKQFSCGVVALHYEK
jgi:dihydrofolate reductase